MEAMCVFKFKCLNPSDSLQTHFSWV